MPKFKPLKPHMKALLLEALRSGKYKRCNGFIRNDKGFCILGVAADLVGPKGWKRHNDGEWTYYGWIQDLPPGTLRRYGMDHSVQGRLTDMNDTYRWTFKRSADWIEKNL